MYTGNGAAKKFLIPSGYNGETVYLVIGSQYVKMTAGENYEISGDYVVFSQVVPSGVMICFELPSGAEATKMKATSYIVIYGDGTIRQVDEDPAIMLEEARNTLEKAESYLDEVRDFAAATLQEIKATGDVVTAEFEGRLLGYTARAEDAIDEAAACVKTDLKEEFTAALEEVRTATQEVQAVQATRSIATLKAAAQEDNEVSNAAEQAAEQAAEEIAEKCSEAIEAYSKMAELKDEMQELYDSAKYAAETVGREIQTAFTRKVNEEIEILKSLRLRMETDYDTIKTKIDTRLDLLKGGRRKCSAVNKSNTEKS